MDPANWDTTTVPAPGSTGRFDLAQTYALFLDHDISGLTLDFAAGHVTASALVQFLQHPRSTLIVAGGANQSSHRSTLIVAGGANQSSHLAWNAGGTFETITIGTGSGSVGVMEISGNPLIRVGLSGVVVGGNGVGLLEFHDGGARFQFDGAGYAGMFVGPGSQVRVSGLGTVLSGIDLHSEGEILVEGGGWLDATFQRTGNSGTFRVRGVDSRLTGQISGFLEVGDRAVASPAHSGLIVHVHSEGELSGDIGNPGFQSSIRGLVEGLGSTVVFQSVVIGGTLDFTSAATGHFGQLGGSPNSLLRIRDPGTTVMIGGYCEVSELEVADAGMLQGTPAFHFGIVSLLPGGIADCGSIEVNGDAQFSVHLGASLAASNFVVREQGLLTGDGAVTSHVDNGGGVAPGIGIGNLTIQGSFIQQPSGKLIVELSPNTEDQLEVAESASLQGLIVVDLSAGLPAIDEPRAILTAASVVGEFVAVERTGYFGRYGVTASYSESTVWVQLREPCFGDADGDRDRDFTDITQVLALFGNSGPSTMLGDADGDGFVAFADVTAVLGSYGVGCP